MEKKTKKLQLRKETIAVLNGESMTHVVGGTDFQCTETAIYGFGQNPTDPNGPGVEGCFCKPGYIMENGQCKRPMDVEGFTKKAKTNTNGFCCDLH